MNKIRVKRLNKKQRLIFLLFLAVTSFSLLVTFGSYVYTKVIDLYFATKNFYFQSEKLKPVEATYSLNYWNGVDPFDIVINLSSKKNNILKSTSDITYDVDYECSDGIICSSTRNSGTIYSSTNNDSFTITLTPNATFEEGDTVSAHIEATSTSPYRKTLSATFTLRVGKYGLTHEIEDSSGNVYLELKVTNSLESYTVKQAFGDYHVGDSISVSTYNSLSNEDKAKCLSARIVVTFDPNVVYIDNNSTTFLHSYDIETQTINGYQYVNKMKFNLDATTGGVVRFYKHDVSQNYTTVGDGVVHVNYEF